MRNALLPPLPSTFGLALRAILIVLGITLSTALVFIAMLAFVALLWAEVTR